MMQDCKVDASKLPNQVLSIFDGLPKMYVESGIVVMKDDAFSVDSDHFLWIAWCNLSSY